MLNWDPAKRPYAKEAMQHEWLTGKVAKKIAPLYVQPQMDRNQYS